MSKFFSLICITSNRPEVERFLVSLKTQGTTEFEVILVDQNNDDRNDAVVKDCAAHYELKHLKVPHFQNTSRARNAGLALASGNWVSFPDDDCWYSENLLKHLKARIEANPGAGGLFTNWADPLQQPKKIMYDPSEGEMSKQELLQYASAICAFFKHEAIQRFGNWNEKLGVGDNNIAMAGDDQELLMRLQANGVKFFKAYDLEVYHPIGHRPWNKFFEKRILGSGATDLYLQRKYFGLYPSFKMVLQWTGGVFYNLLRFRKQNFKWYYLKLKGAILLSGKIAYEPAKDH